MAKDKIKNRIARILESSPGGVYQDFPFSARERKICVDLAKKIKDELKNMSDGKRLFQISIITGNGHDWEDSHMANGEEFMNWGMLIVGIKDEHLQIEIIHRGDGKFLVYGLEHEFRTHGINEAQNGKISADDVLAMTIEAAEGSCWSVR